MKRAAESDLDEAQVREKFFQLQLVSYRHKLYRLVARGRHALAPRLKRRAPMARPQTTLTLAMCAILFYSVSMILIVLRKGCPHCRDAPAAARESLLRHHLSNDGH